MNKKFPFILIVTIVLVFGLSLSFQSFILAWSEPTLAPPDGGGSGVFGKWQESTIDTNDIYFDTGQVGIGTENIPANLELNIDGRIGATEYCDETGSNCQNITNLSNGSGEKDRFFLLSNNKYKGDLQQEAIDLGYSGTSGIIGANQVCHYEVNNYYFKEKNTRYFPESQVKAFICNNSSCNNLLASTEYIMGKIGSASIGGWTFTTDSSGLGPNDSKNWTDVDAFGVEGNVWSNRGHNTHTAWPNSNDSNDVCDDYESLTGIIISGVLNHTNEARWNYVIPNVLCDSYQHLICVVEGSGTLKEEAWHQNDTNVFYNNGNVGVKTDTPLHELVIKDDTGNSGIYIWGDSQNAELALGDGSNHWAIYNDVTGTNDLKFWNNNTSNLLTLTDEGHIGINTESPSGNLHIISNYYNYNRLEGFDPGLTSCSCDINDNLNCISEDMTSDPIGTECQDYVNSCGMPFCDRWYVYRSTASDFLISGQKVGIGTNNPEATLDVKGSIRASYLCNSDASKCLNLNSNYITSPIPNATQLENNGYVIGSQKENVYLQIWDNMYSSSGNTNSFSPVFAIKSDSASCEINNNCTATLPKERANHSFDCYEIWSHCNGAGSCYTIERIKFDPPFLNGTQDLTRTKHCLASYGSSPSNDCTLSIMCLTSVTY